MTMSSLVPTALSASRENGATKNAGGTIILFGKYRGDFETQQECQAFADVVAAVLNHMTKMER